MKIFFTGPAQTVDGRLCGLLTSRDAGAGTLAHALSPVAGGSHHQAVACQTTLNTYTQASRTKTF